MLLDGWRELRVDDVGATWRIVDRVDIDAIVILDVFKKKSHKTPREVIAACKLRITSYDEVDYAVKEKRKAALKKAGWNVGDTADFLKLSDQEAALIELKLVLARALKKRRQSSKLTQSELARLLRSSQSRIAKMEAGDPTVSFDLLIRSLLSLGASPKQIAKVIGS